jgi:hypothetical protein
MSWMTKESRSWHLGTGKIFLVWLLGTIVFSLIVAMLTASQGSPLTPNDAEMFTAMGSFIGATSLLIGTRMVRKTKVCPKLECEGTMVKILATGKYVCQVCGSETGPEESTPSPESSLH